MKTRIIILYFLLISIILPVFIPTTALASVNVPDEEFTIETVRAYSNAIEQNDLLYLVEYSILYSTGTPTDYTAEDLFSCRMYDGTTIIDSVNPYSYSSINDYGFNHGIISFYFSADDAEDLGLSLTDTYTFNLVGNPLIDWATGTPPSISIIGPTSYFDGNPYSNIDEQIRVRIGDFSRQFEDDWNLDADYLADWTTGKPVLTYYGETYFLGAVPNLSRISPSLFSAAVKHIDYEEPYSYILHYCSGSKVSGSISVYYDSVSGTDARVAQYFIADKTGQVGSIKSLFVKLLLGSGSLTASIYNSVSGSITGAALCYGSVNTTPLNTGIQWITFDVGTPTTIIKGHEYTLEFRANDGDSVNRMLSRWNVGDCCSGGNASSTKNAWTTRYDYPNNDIPFTLMIPSPDYANDYYEDTSTHGLFDFTGAADMFGVSTMMIAGITAIILIYVFMIKSRNQTMSTSQSFTVFMVTLIGISLLFGVVEFMLACVLVVVGVALWNVFMRNSSV